MPEGKGRTRTLPPPDLDGGVPLNKVIASRVSRRDLKGGSLTDAQVSQLLWAGQGRSATSAARTVPSAGALYPLELYLVQDEKVFLYENESHSLQVVVEGLDRDNVAQAALGQQFVADAGVNIVIAADFSKTRTRYRDRTERYVYMEAGHAAQNILLEATSLGLGSVPVGAFDDRALARMLGLPSGLSAIYMVSIGAA
jgi:SagB-type dehydrogenase family enzyme